MKIAIITGSYPPQPCGIGDYTFRLVNSLQAKRIDIDVITNESWNLLSIFHIIKKINLSKPDFIHIEYPTIGYRYSLVPQMLSILYPSIVTIHEVSQVHILRKISLLPFLIFGKHIIFTTSYEQQYTSKITPWILKKSTIIPVNTYIPIGETHTRNITDIIYFGLIRPEKGVEKVLELAALLKQNETNISVRMIGRVDISQIKYFEHLKHISQGLPVKWELELSDEQVASILSKANIAYLPFPDGASERRTSLLAVLVNGLATITTKGKQTPKELNEAVKFADTPQESFEIIKQFLTNNQLVTDLSIMGKKYSNKFSWDSIAENHIVIYNDIDKHIRKNDI